MENWHFIGIEGVIGVGKTTLANILGRRFRAKVILEEVEENPFLPQFYENPPRYAFVTQLFFLLSRYNSLKEITTRDIFARRVVSDYIFEKDRIFAAINLDDRERLLYEKIYTLLERDIPSPDLVIYLQADTDVLLERIKKRGRPYEMNIDPDYIKVLNETYNDFFLHYRKGPVLIVNSNRFNFPRDEKAVDLLVEKIKDVKSGLNFLSMEGK